MARTTTADTITIKKSELKAMLREVVREVVHEELQKTAAQAEPWQFDPESPLYQALVELRADMRAGHAELLTDKQVWGK